MEFAVIECIPSEFPDKFRVWCGEFFRWRPEWEVKDVKHDGNFHYICVDRKG